MTSKSMIGASAWLFLVCGCGDNNEPPAPLPPGEEMPAERAADTLAGILDGDGASRIACSNITVAIANVVATEAVVIDVALLAPLDDAPPPLGEVIAFDLAELPTALRVQYGSNLTREACNDAIEPANLPVVDAEFLPIAGTLRVEIIEHLEAFPTYRARVWLDDVRFTPDGAAISLDLGTDTFGWLPG